MSALSESYIGLKNLSSIKLDGKLINLNVACVTSIGTEYVNYEDLPIQSAGIVVNHRYSSGTFLQVFYGWPSLRQFSRVITPSTQTVNTGWKEVLTSHQSLSGYFKVISLDDVGDNRDIAKINIPGVFGILAVDNFTGLPGGYTTGILVNLKYSGTGMVQIFFTLGLKVYLQLVNGSSGAKYLDWFSFQDDFLTASYKTLSLHMENVSATDYDNLLANVDIPAMWGFPANSGWTDLPVENASGMVFNFRYGTGTFIQYFHWFTPMRLWVRVVGGGTVYTNWREISAHQETIWYALGDSITAGSYSNDEGKGIAANDAEWSYPRRIERLYGIKKVYNLGIPGQAITELKTEADKVKSDATLITITGGANDYYGRTKPLGTIEDTDYSTVMGAIRAVIEQVAATAPNARIVLISPLIIKFGTIDTKWSLNHKGRNGFSYADLSDAMKEIAAYYNIQFIDGTREGPTNILNISSVQKDGVHPTIGYYETYANWLGSKLF